MGSILTLLQLNNINKTMWKYIIVLSLALCSCGSQYKSSCPVEQSKEKYYSQLDCENCDEID